MNFARVLYVDDVIGWDIPHNNHKKSQFVYSEEMISEAHRPRPESIERLIDLSIEFEIWERKSMKSHCAWIICDEESRTLGRAPADRCSLFTKLFTILVAFNLRRCHDHRPLLLAQTHLTNCLFQWRLTQLAQAVQVTRTWIRVHCVLGCRRCR